MLPELTVQIKIHNETFVYNPNTILHTAMLTISIQDTDSEHIFKIFTKCVAPGSICIKEQHKRHIQIKLILII